MLRTIAACLSIASLVSCSGVPRIPGVTPHRIEIQQGNYVTQDMVSRLKPGMSRAQVRFVLGTPLVTDIFHAGRWDYVYFREDPDGTRSRRRLAVHFTDDRLDRVEGDVVPARPVEAAASGEGASAASPGTGDKPAQVQAIPERRPVEEQSLPGGKR